MAPMPPELQMRKIMLLPGIHRTGTLFDPFLACLSPRHEGHPPGQSEAMLRRAGFQPVQTWTDAKGWFAVCMARAI